jgi:hypothetical protein
MYIYKCLKVHKIKLSTIRGGIIITHKHANEKHDMHCRHRRKYEIVVANRSIQFACFKINKKLETSFFLPCPYNRDAMKRVFPPGAAQQSTIVSPGCGSTTETTRPAAGPSCMNTSYE